MQPVAVLITQQTKKLLSELQEKGRRGLIHINFLVYVPSHADHVNPASSRLI